LQSSFNTYLKVFKKTVGTLDSGAEEIKKLLKLGASV
jgi:hypothetical protein